MPNVLEPAIVGSQASTDYVPIDVAMIGPFPRVWGGQTRGGGVATHVQGLTLALLQHSIRLRILADNTDENSRVPIPECENQIQVHSMVRFRGLRALRDMTRLGLGRIERITWKILSQPHLRNAAPVPRQLKFIGQAANFDKFLVEKPAHILHVHHAEYRQYLCQQVLGVETSLVATVHGVTIVVRSSPDWLVSLITANYRRADWLIAVSNYVKQVLVKHGANPNRITVIPNGVNVDIFVPSETHKARERLDLPTNRFIGLFVGNLKPWKGVNVLLQAFRRCAARYPHMYIIIIGTGPEQDNLEHLADQLGIAERVTFAGYKSFAEMALWYQACDVLVLPSRAEGFGLAALEAMSCGKPVIVSFPLVGEHDFVKQGETGLLTNYGDIDQLAHALDQLISAPELARRLGTNARSLVEREFSWNVIGCKTVKVYHTLLAEKRRRHG